MTLNPYIVLLKSNFLCLVSKTPSVEKKKSLVVIYSEMTQVYLPAHNEKMLFP